MGKLRVLDLFSGIGGFSLGLERTGGFETVAFCEIEEFPRRVLAKHWPNVPCYPDVRELNVIKLRADGISDVDVICGGFPCQDISFAGHGAGLDGERSGLWSEIVRLSGELRPRFVVVENVAALLSRGMGRVLGDLASIGYDAEWHCIPASYVGARHRRDRIWIVAHPQLREGEQRHVLDVQRGRSSQAEQIGLGRGDVANAQCGGLQGGHEQRAWPTAIFAAALGRYRRGGKLGETWRTEPDVGRVAHGIPDAAHRLKGLGNAVVPQIPELIGRAILASLTQSFGSPEDNARHFDPAPRELVGTVSPWAVPAFVPPFIADDQAFEDGAAQLANRADRSAPDQSFIHASGVAKS